MLGRLFGMTDHGPCCSMLGNDVPLNVDPVVADNLQGHCCALSADQMLQQRLRGPRPYEPTCEVTKHSGTKTLKGTDFEDSC